MAVFLLRQQNLLSDIINIAWIDFPYINILYVPDGIEIIQNKAARIVILSQIRFMNTKKNALKQSLTSEKGCKLNIDFLTVI